MKTLKILFLTVIAFISITFLSIIHSSFVSEKIFEYISKKIPLTYSEIKGTLYSGINIKNLNYDNSLKIDDFYIDMSIFSLLIYEISIEDLRINGITIDEKLFENNSNSQESNFLENLPLTLFIKNMEASLQNYTYDKYKIEKLSIKSKDINSNLRTFINGNFYLNIDSNIAQIDSFIKLKGEQNNINFEINSNKLEIKNDSKIITFNNLLAFGKYDLSSKDLQINDLTSNIIYDIFSSDIKANLNMKNLDLNSLIFDINSNLTIQKSISKYLQKDVQIKTNLNGNLNDINFSNEFLANNLNINKQNINIQNSTFNGQIKKEKEKYNITANSNIKSNLVNEKSKIDLIIDEKNLENIVIKAKTTLNNIKYENLKSSALGSINIDTIYKKNFFDMKINSKIADISLFSNDFNKFIFDLNLKELNPNDFYKLENDINISNIKGKLSGEYKENLSLKGNLILNNSFNLTGFIEGNKNNLNASFSNDSFYTKILKNQEDINIKTNIKEIENFEKEINKIYKLPSLDTKGSINFDVSINQNTTSFSILSPKIIYDNNNIEKVDIEGNLIENNILFKKFNFSILDIYDINLKKDFVLKKPTNFNIDTFEGNFIFDNISLSSSKNNDILNLKINTENLFISNNNYGNGTLNSQLLVEINPDNKVLVKGDAKILKLIATYQIPAMNISKDKDIIIVSKNHKNHKKDIFFEDVALEISLFVDNLNYKVKNIDLKASSVLYLKKTYNDNIKIYGSVTDIKGEFSELGKKYIIEDSSIYFRGLTPIDPILDIRALYKLTDVDINILISGTLNYPRINLSSTPVMNQKDILSFLIFGTKFADDTQKSTQSKQSQASLFLLNELSKDYAKELGVDILYFEFNPTTQYIETYIGKNISQKNKIILKNKADTGQLIFMRELTKLWNVELGFEQNTQSLDLIYKKRY